MRIYDNKSISVIVIILKNSLNDGRDEYKCWTDYGMTKIVTTQRENASIVTETCLAKTFYSYVKV